MRTLSLCVVLLTICITTFGQNQSEKPNLSGTWQLSESKNVAKLKDQSEAFVRVLLIVHHEPEIKMSTQIKDNGREKRLDEIFFSDTRGETNSTFRENQSLKSKTKWDGNKLEVRRVDEISVTDPAGDTKSIKLEIKERWELSKDANTLTKTTSVSGPPGVTMKNAMGGGSVKEVFVRVSKGNDPHLRTINE